MSVSYISVCKSAESEHGIRFYSENARAREVTVVLGSKGASMLRHEKGSKWVGTYRETRDVSLGDQIHRVRGSKGQVAEWLVSALLDGPRDSYAAFLKMDYSVRAVKYGAIASGRSSTFMQSDFARKDP